MAAEPASVEIPVAVIITASVGFIASGTLAIVGFLVKSAISDLKEALRLVQSEVKELQQRFSSLEGEHKARHQKGSE